jgi:hypothetical protein
MLTELLWIWGPWIYNKYTEIYNTCHKVTKAVEYELYNTKEWLYLTTAPMPVSMELFDCSKIQESQIKWRATLDPPIFKDPAYSGSNHKHISYLGFSVVRSGDPALDLTDWINEVKWSGTVQPSPLEIFSLWCCKNKSPLIYSNPGLIVEIITEDGDCIKQGLNDLPRTTVYENGTAVG